MILHKVQLLKTIAAPLLLDILRVKLLNFNKTNYFTFFFGKPI